MIENETLVGLDIETSNGLGSGSLNSRDKNSSIALMQFSFEDSQIRICRAEEGMRLLSALNDRGTRFIIHNASFELDWFIHKYNFPIHTMKIWCPMTASQIINAGKEIPDEASWISSKMSKKNNDHLGKWNPLIREDDENIANAKTAKFTHNLQATVFRYADGVILEKDQAVSDWAAEPLSEEQIRYAKDDVRYLIQVARNQWEFVKKFGMERVIQLEMELIPATVEMKKNGVKIDLNNWKKSSLEYKEKADKLEVNLNHRMGLELSRREGAVSLFGTIIPKSFKVSSASQLAKYFNIESADEAHLRDISDTDPIINEILEYKECFKISSTYGDNYLGFLDRDDSRIHSMLVQTETATGRFSSRKPNLQNIPRDMLKGFITVDEGNILVTADYSSMESRILAYAAEDENFIRSVNSEDVHWENAKNIFKLPENSTKKEIFYVESFKKNIPGDELRRMAKGVSFG